MLLLGSIALIIVLLYIAAIALFSVGLNRKKHVGTASPGNEASVSLVIPFRNEGENLNGLVQDLMVQTYPPGLFEVIFVNDHSGDDSKKVVGELVAHRAGFVCLDLPAGKEGKKEALRYGIARAAYDRIIQLDADCRVGDRFIAAHMAHMEHHSADLVAGLLTTGGASKGFMESFERMDLLSLGGVSAASFNLKRPMMCSGANLAYRKELYHQTRLHDPSGRVDSGDDMFLMIGARKLGRTLSFNLDPESVVSSTPVSKLSDFLDQRVRWGAKTRFYKQWDIELLAWLVLLTNLVCLLLPLWILVFPSAWPWILGAVVLKTGVDGFLISRTSKISRQKFEMKCFLLASMAYYPVFLMILIRFVSGPGAWKGRKSR